MTVRTEVTRIENNVANAYLAAASKGAILPVTQNIANLASTITSIPAEDTSNSLCNYDVVLSEVEAYGKCEQTTTPTTQSPQNIVCNNGVISVQKNNPLPLGYTQLDYLESTGTQAILTDYRPLGADTIEVDYTLTNLSQGGDKFIIGSRPNSSAENVGFWVETYGATNTWYVRYGSPSSVNDAYQNSDASGTFSITKNVFKINGVTRLTPTYEGDPTYNLSIFARRNRDDTVWVGAYVQISNVRVYGSDSVLKHNYVPAKNSSNVLGMYDTVSGTFYTNVGSGNFTYGSTIPRVADTIITTGTQETITDAAGNTSTCEMLLSVGNYADIQEIIGGQVTHNVGVKILDGTENFETATATNCYSLTNTLGTGNFADRTILCSHFANTPTMPGTGDRQGFAFIVNKGQEYTIAFGATTEFSTQALWKQFLTDQYNAGTPVIVIYPLATATTESVTPQIQLVKTPLAATGSLNNLVVDPYKEMIASNINLTNKLAGIEKIESGFEYLFTNNENITGSLSFTSLETISGSVFNSFAGTRITSASFPAMTSMTGDMSYCFSKCDYMQTLTFGALQYITHPSGQNGPSFVFMANTSSANPALTGVYFPALESIGINCNYVFQYAFYGQKNLTTVSLPVLSAIYSDYVFDWTFGNCIGLQIISFPSLTTIGSGKTHVFNNAFDGCTNLAEIHFKTSMQSAIESQVGYSSRWGATNATIYFDL